MFASGPTHAQPGTVLSHQKNSDTKGGFTYGLLLNGDGVSQAHHVSGDPTFYAIAGKGRIIHRHSGYGQGMEAEVYTSDKIA